LGATVLRFLGLVFLRDEDVFLRAMLRIIAQMG